MKVYCSLFWGVSLVYCTCLSIIVYLRMASSQCLENPPSLDSTSGIGSVQEIGDLKAYVTGPQDSKLAILLIHDAFGYEAPKLRKLADKVAANGFLVVVPDFFYGDPLDPDYSEVDRQAWLKAHSMDKGCEDAKPVIAALRSKGVTSIGAAGFCWGGVVVVKLARSKDIQAGVVLHPGPITEDDINEVICPIAILGAEIDRFSPPEQLKHLGEILSTKSGVDSFVKIFPGVNHGWAVRYSDDDESAVKSAEESHEDMLNWFTKKLADKVAANGFLVVVPDFFYGDPLDLGIPNVDSPDWKSWLKVHGMDKGCEDAKPVISALRSKGVTSIGAAGFCWGGVVVVKLARSDDIQAGVVLHPGPITDDDINEVKRPIAILGAEIDNSSPPEKVKHFGEILSAKSGVDSFVKIYPGVSHGWSVRYSDDDESAVKSAEESHEDMLNWFTKCQVKEVFSKTSSRARPNIKPYKTRNSIGYTLHIWKLADKVSANGFLVVVPDFFYGDPYPYDLDDPKLDREAWRKAHGKDKGCEDAKTVISALRSKGVTSVGAAGFCWGGVVVVKLASSDYIQAGVVLHPGRITEDEINEVKCPISILGAEIDSASPPEQMKHFGEILSAKPGVDSFVKIFPGVNHGWSVRYDDDNESAVKSAEESHEDMLDWFTKYIK
ncbi:hypothetical protein RHSIM_Rhsim04G0207900 [Rhododendron simsii]|uniref:Dienelactone hydrolase domain-containing protein n=1 Tax=Rhododendron simsii TaxID=118357 RepID=A0A834H8D3_RHOSS|nr:hypothetical protein RHSIM_Rhsim04G0207900 [Rhododendron simsii]